MRRLVGLFQLEQARSKGREGGWMVDRSSEGAGVGQQRFGEGVPAHGRRQRQAAGRGQSGRTEQFSNASKHHEAHVDDPAASGQRTAKREPGPGRRWRHRYGRERIAGLGGGHGGAQGLNGVVDRYHQAAGHPRQPMERA